MSKKKHIEVVKVFLTNNEKPIDHPQTFNRIPRLYLELLENKSKIKQDLINKEYTPNSTSPQPSARRQTQEPDDIVDSDVEPSVGRQYNRNDRHHQDDQYNLDLNNKDDRHHQDDQYNRDNRDNLHHQDNLDNRHHQDDLDDRHHKDDLDDRHHQDDQDDLDDRHHQDDQYNREVVNRDNRHNQYNRDLDIEEGKEIIEDQVDMVPLGRSPTGGDHVPPGRSPTQGSVGLRDTTDDPTEPSGRSPTGGSPVDNQTSTDRKDQDLSERLKELLNDTDEEISNKSVKKHKKNKNKRLSDRPTYNNDYTPPPADNHGQVRPPEGDLKDNRKTSDQRFGIEEQGDKYSRSNDNMFNSKSKHRSSTYKSFNKDDKPQPSLAELQAQGAYSRTDHLRDIDQINNNEQESEDRKRELLFKFDLLRKSYPNASVPDFSIHSDAESMQRAYDDGVRRLSLDSTVENYKTYLIGGFMLVEFIFGNFLSFDMQGFTQQQILSMNSYDKLLIELGEKSYVPTGSKWPVEIRLLFLIIMNAAFFIVSKMIMKKTGANLMNMMNGLNTTSTTRQKKRKMKGPNVDIDDIPDV